MSKYLVISTTEIRYTDTAKEAALAGGFDDWNWLAAERAIRELQPGDELDLDANTSVIALTGKNETFTR